MAKWGGGESLVERRGTLFKAQYTRASKEEPITTSSCSIFMSRILECNSISDNDFTGNYPNNKRNK